MFLGTHAPRLDDKGRLTLPARFRDDLRDGLVLTKGQDRCLVVWPADAFGAYATTLRDAAQTTERVRAYTRVLFASAHDDTPDRQGRITIPPTLREYADLDRSVVVVGADTRLEVWSEQAWARYLGSHEQAFADLDGEVGQLS